jgi:divalent metal cation (Fe/Co/Zn/Cd) transporter
MSVALDAHRLALVRRGQWLEYFTIAWNSLEALVSILAGLAAGSISLLAFGLDSLIEVASGAALLWRLRHEFNPSRRESAERTTHRIVGACFLALSAYVAAESASGLLRREAPAPSIPGIAIAAAAVVVMPLLARAKRRVAAGIASGAMRSDARQADFCMYLSAILLAGLVLNAVLGWWWADPAAGLVMVPIIAREGLNGLRGQSCCEDCG